nr:flagellar hook-basal body complex protein FliE [uncultured Roseateles sp.]
MSAMSAMSAVGGTGQVQAELARIELDALRLASGPAGEAGEAAGQGFGHSLQQALHGVDGKEQLAIERMGAVERGDSDDLVGAMLASQDASLSFSMLMQVRNKLAGAMDELIKLQL